MGNCLSNMVVSPVAHLLLITLGFIAFVGMLPGAEANETLMKQKFDEADTNKDGRICYHEYHEFNPNVSEGRFDEAAGTDKTLDLEEFTVLEATGSAPPPGVL